MSILLSLGRSNSGASVTWTGADNPHIAVSGRSGSGKSYGLKGLLEQAARQGAVCLVLDYSSDFRTCDPPKDVPFRTIDVVEPNFTINPLADPSASGRRSSAQRLLSALHSVFRMGPRANLALQKTALAYLSQAKAPTLEGLVDFINADERPVSTGLAAAVEPLELLTTLVHCGDCPTSLDLTSPGITVLGFDQVADGKMRTLLVELILGSVWDQRTSVTSCGNPPLILLLDECQNLNWGGGSMAVRILREGRKFGVAGWFSSQYIQNKNAVAALGQAALQAYFRPDDANVLRLAKAMSQTGHGKPEQWGKVIRSLRVGQFLLQKQGGKPVIVTVPAREA